MSPPVSIQGAAPVVLFAYARPAHLEKTLASLRANPGAADTALRIYCDAAKRPEHEPDVKAVRSIAARVTGFASVEVVYRETNLGLARSVISGVTDMLDRHERVIVLEDDLELSPYFLQYMNDALHCYADDDRVASVHGYCYPVTEQLPETFFLRGADCWGWATWRRAWRHFQPDGAALLRQLREAGLTRRFDLDGSHPFTRMLEDQIAGRNDSWAIRWHASCFLRDMLTLYPGQTQVENTGNDASGTHSIATRVYSGNLSQQSVQVSRLPLQESEAARRSFVQFFRRQRRGQIGRLWRGVARRLGLQAV